MKILLFGEYNRAHRNIKKGLERLGHKAIVVSTQDGFKKVAVDIKLKDYFTTYVLKKLRNACIRFFNLDLSAISIKLQIKSKKEKLIGYDIVQFINEAPFDFDREQQKDIFDLLIKWNSKVFLLSCGLDYPSVKYAFDKKFRYDILTPYFEGKGAKHDFSPALSYLTKVHIKLHQHVFNTIEGVISNDLDYYIPLKDHPKHLGMIPHAIDADKLKYKTPIIEDKIIFFHGVNTYNYYKKGNDIFDEALALISETHSESIKIIRTENLAYKDYIKHFDEAHILLDQIYAYDQGFNALEAMAKGKVVFTGAEKEWLEFYNIEEDTIAINALPDAKAIAKKLIWLIEHPEKIKEISKNGRAFVEQHHNYIDCAKAYLNLWKS